MHRFKAFVLMSAVLGFSDAACAQIVIDPFPAEGGITADAPKSVPLPGPEYFEPVPVQEIYKSAVSTGTMEAPDSQMGEASSAIWGAEEGESLRRVLERWSAAAGVGVVWGCAEAFTVISAMNVVGSYAQAVESLLDQYRHTDSRPVARLHVDPQTDERFLVVETL